MYDGTLRLFMVMCGPVWFLAVLFWPTWFIIILHGPLWPDIVHESLKLSEIVMLTSVAKLSSSRLVQSSSAELRFALILVITATHHPPTQNPRESRI